MRSYNDEKELGFELLGTACVPARPTPEEWAVVGEALQVEPYAIMLRKDDPTFKALVDGMLAKPMGNGECERLCKKWFQSAMARKGRKAERPNEQGTDRQPEIKPNRPAT